MLQRNQERKILWMPCSPHEETAREIEWQQIDPELHYDPQLSINDLIKSLQEIRPASNYWNLDKMASFARSQNEDFYGFESHRTDDYYRNALREDAEELTKEKVKPKKKKKSLLRRMACLL